MEQLNANAARNRQLYSDYVQENTKLSEPLHKVSAQVVEVRATLRERHKDQLALKNAKARLVCMQHAVDSLRRDYAMLEQQFQV